MSVWRVGGLKGEIPCTACQYGGWGGLKGEIPCTSCRYGGWGVKGDMYLVLHVSMEGGG